MRMRLVLLEKKQLSCLGCGTTMWTDAAHRMCSKCRRHNSAVRDVPVYGSGGLQEEAAL